MTRDHRLRARRTSALWLTLPTLLAGCPSPTTPANDAAVVVDAGPTMPDAFVGHDAGVDAFVSPDAFVEPDAFVDLDAGPDAWTRPAPVFTASELAILATLAPLPDLRPDPTNPVADDPDAAALGHALFFDARYSGPLAVDSDLGTAGESGRLSCASCHDGDVMSDTRSMPANVSLGADFHTRNAPAIVNSARYQWTNWGGRFSTQWELPPAVAESGVILNSSRLAIAHHVFDNYRTEYEALFGPMEPAIGTDTTRFPLTGRPRSPTGPSGAWETMTAADQDVVNRIFVNYGMVLAAYMRTLVTSDSDLDRFVAGDAAALDVDEQWGLRVFIGDGRCVSCHSGPMLSDDEFHDLGVPQMGPHVPAIDDGRYSSIPPLLASPLNAAGIYSGDRTAGAALLAGLTNPPPESTRGAFRTASLRDVAQSAPYMHSGQLATLDDVIDFYDAGGGTPASGTLDHLIFPLGLSDQEHADLAAFLRALDTDPVPLALRTAP